MDGYVHTFMRALVPPTPCRHADADAAAAAAAATVAAAAAATAVADSTASAAAAADSPTAEFTTVFSLFRIDISGIEIANFLKNIICRVQRNSFLRSLDLSKHVILQGFRNGDLCKESRYYLARIGPELTGYSAAESSDFPRSRPQIRP